MFSYSTKLSKSFYNLAPHISLRLRFRLWVIDSWEGEAMTIRIDGISKWVGTYSTGTVNVCGAAYGEPLVGSWIDINVTHITPTLLIEIYSTLNEGPINESWGARDF